MNDAETPCPHPGPAAPAPSAPKQRCAARRRGKDVTCRQYPLRGATRCKLHGGLQQILPQGDPRRGGRPPTHRLYCRTLTPEMMEAYQAADPKTLEHEIRVACANAARLQALFDANPTKGIAVTVSRGGADNGSVHILPYAQLLAEQHDLIRKLKLAQTLLDSAKRGDTSALEAWARAWSHRGVAHRSPSRSIETTIDARPLLTEEVP